MRRHVLGLLLLWSATVLAQARDAPPSAPRGPSGDAGPVDPYANPPYVNPSAPPAPQTNTPPPSQQPPPSTNVPASPESPAPSQPVPPSQGAPAPSQQQPPPQAPQPNTTPPDAKPTPPASEQQPTPSIDKPAPAPVDQPAPPTDRPAQSGAAPRAPVTSLSPPGETPPMAPEPRAAIVDVANAPSACRDAGSRVSSRDHNTALSAKVSFAICTASSAMATMSLVDAEASVHDLDHATGNAFALLDEVAAAGDPRWQIVALHARGDLLAQMTRRMLDTVPPAGAGAPQAAVELHDSRMQLLQAHVDPWIQQAQQAFAEVDQLARANPQLAKDQLVGGAVADSRRRMPHGVATR